ncbi:MAG: beta-lactamase family protein [Gemmatimonadetes bacterium]|nr:beta-lactamase family protein [Gemmatimonadota bacterium]
MPGDSRSARRWRPRELQEIDLEQILRLTSVPSLAVATVDGERLAARAVGVLQRGGTARATADTPYAAASLTKGVVAYAALALVHDGALVLDRPVHEYLSLPNADDARAERITARHLLSHSGGWRNWRFGPTPPLVADFDRVAMVVFRASSSCSGCWAHHRSGDRAIVRNVS